MQDALEVLVHGRIVCEISDLNLTRSPFQPQNNEEESKIPENAKTKTTSKTKIIEQNKYIQPKNATPKANMRKKH